MKNNIEKKIIYIDCSATIYSGVNTGIQRVVRNITKCAVEQMPSADFKVIPVVVLWGIIFEVTPEIVQINRSKLIDFGSAAKLKVETTRTQIRKNLSNASIFGLFFVKFFELWDRIFRMFYKILKYTRVMHFVVKSGLHRVEPRDKDYFVFLDCFWLYDLPLLFKRGLKNCVNNIAVIYDIIPILHEDVVEEAGRGLFRNAIGYLLPRLTQVVAISKSVAVDVKNLIGNDFPECVSKIKVSHFYLGANFKPIAKGSDASVSEELKTKIETGKGKLWLIVGTLEPRKNHGFVLDAFEEIWKSGGEDRLVIVGRVGWKCDDVLSRIQNHPLLGLKLIYLKHLSDTDLQYCYMKADALIFASRTEGFGLPLVEAMFYQVPVACSDIPVFREVGGDYPQYFSLSSPVNLADVIRKGISRKQGTPIVPLSWSDSTRQLFDQL